MADSLTIEEYCKIARGHLKEGRLDDAVAAFAQAARLNELDPDVHEGLATAYYLKQDYQAAIQHFERVTRLDPRRGSAWINLGAVYNRVSNYQKAAEVLRRAVQIERKSGIGYYNLGYAYKHLKQWALAVPAYREAIRLEPRMADAYLNLGNVYVAMKNFAQAASHFRKALDLEPGQERAIRGLEKAEAELEEAKNKASPFGRLVAPPAAEPAGSAVAASTRELTEDERRRDRRKLEDLLALLQTEYDALHRTISGQLNPAVRTLNKMVTQPLSPHGVSITREEAFDQFLEARSMYLQQLAPFQTTLRQLREHEAQFQ
jgi:tetratricopeptide (TPR) repeat protein